MFHTFLGNRKYFFHFYQAMGFLHASGLVVPLNSPSALLYHTFGAVSGSAWAQMAVGYRYWSGIGVSANCEKSLEQYRRVAATVASEVSATGTGPAIQRIRLLDELEGSGVVTSGGGSNGNVLNSDILDYYTMLAERGDVQAQVRLSNLVSLTEVTPVESICFSVRLHFYIS